MTTKDFDWYGDSESVVVRHQPAIAVYLNPHGEVVIRQEGQYDEDHWIYVTRDNAVRGGHDRQLAWLPVSTYS